MKLVTSVPFVINACFYPFNCVQNNWWNCTCAFFIQIASIKCYKTECTKIKPLFLKIEHINPHVFSSDMFSVICSLSLPSDTDISSAIPVYLNIYTKFHQLFHFWRKRELNIYTKFHKLFHFWKKRELL